MPTKLKDLKIDRVDLVDKGANPDAHILLFKRKGDEGVMKFEEIMKKLTPEQQTAVMEEINKAKGADMTPEEKKKKEAEMAAMGKMKDDLAKRDQEVKDLTAKVEELTKSKTGDGEGDDKDIFKGLNPEVKKYLEDMKKEADAAKAIVKAMEETRLIEQYTSVAKSFNALPIKAEEFGPVLKSFAQADKDSYAKLEAMLKSFNEAVSKGALFKELGTSSSNSADPYAKMEAKAQELVQKSSTPLSKEQAMVQIMRTEPELYNDYIKSIKGGE